MWENVGIMTLPISLPNTVTRSLVDRLIDHDRAAAMYAKARLDANAIFATGFEAPGKGTAARRVRPRSAGAGQS
jgi:hypothetical protein